VLRLTIVLASRVLLVALMVGTSLAVGCRQPGNVDRPLASVERTPAPASSGSCDFDLAGSQSDAVFYVLGVLSEYLGRRFVEGDDRVEVFYCDEKPLAALFQHQLTKLGADQGFDPEIRKELGPDCLITYRSRPISARLNSCYRYQLSTDVLSQGADGRYKRTAEASLSMQLFLRNGHGATTSKGWPDEVFHRRRALAYIAGAWARYRRGADFVFANAQDKSKLVAQLLTNLGAHDVRLESTFGLIPQANIVHFQPTDEISEWLQKVW
jgi:hypothetical protein